MESTREIAWLYQQHGAALVLFGTTIRRWQKAVLNIRRSYIAALNDKSLLPDLQAKIANAPADLQQVIPNPKRVLEEKRDFSDQLRHIRDVLQ